MKNITRRQALDQGLDRYYTGVPCVNGHFSERNTRWRYCLACARDTQARVHSDDPAKASAEFHRRRQAEIAEELAERQRGSAKEIVTREQAKERGLPRYYTGIPCANGHLSERLTRGKVCLACHRERATRRRGTVGDRIKAQKAASYRRHRDEVLQKSKDYVAANRETVRKRRKAFREANKDKIAARFKAWAKANRPLLRVHERRRRDRHRGAVGRHTLAEVKALEVSQGMRCANPLCRADLSAGYHQDHILPLVLGGTDDIANIQLLCSPCNLSKGDLHPDEWHKRLHG